jgi:hypothetical protein
VILNSNAKKNQIFKQEFTIVENWPNQNCSLPKWVKLNKTIQNIFSIVYYSCILFANAEYDTRLHSLITFCGMLSTTGKAFVHFCSKFIQRGWWVELRHHTNVVCYQPLQQAIQSNYFHANLPKHALQPQIWLNSLATHSFI